MAENPEVTVPTFEDLAKEFLRLTKTAKATYDTLLLRGGSNSRTNYRDACQDLITFLIEHRNDTDLYFCTKNYTGERQWEQFQK